MSPIKRLLNLPVCLLFLVCATHLWAGEARPMTDDPVIESRVHRLGEELRCLVCQNQTIADSHSGLAEDLRREMRLLMASGKSDKEVVDFMVTRYGDFVRYRPPFKATTALLWGGPFLLLLIAVFALYRFFKQPRQENDS